MVLGKLVEGEHGWVVKLAVGAGLAAGVYYAVTREEDGKADSDAPPAAPPRKKATVETKVKSGATQEEHARTNRNSNPQTVEKMKTAVPKNGKRGGIAAVANNPPASDTMPEPAAETEEERKARVRQEERARREAYIREFSTTQR